MADWKMLGDVFTVFIFYTSRIFIIYCHEIVTFSLAFDKIKAQSPNSLQNLFCYPVALTDRIVAVLILLYCACALWYSTGFDWEPSHSVVPSIPMDHKCVFR